MMNGNQVTMLIAAGGLAVFLWYILNPPKKEKCCNNMAN